MVAILSVIWVLLVLVSTSAQQQRS